VPSVQLHTYCDSDFASDSSTRASQGGFVSMLNNGAVSWRSRKSTIIAQSSCEAELVAATEAANDIKWMSMLCAKLDLKIQRPLKIFCDNMATIHVSNNTSVKSRLKHVDLRYAVIRQYVEQELFTLRHVPTAQQPADIMTKALNRILHGRHTAAMGLVKM
jgi:hypothetical protein